MPAAADLTWTEIKDFTPGIADDPGANWPPGQAQRTNTHRCRAKPSGALIPSFAQTSTIAGTAWEASTPTGTAGYLIVGLYATGSLSTTTAGGDDSTHRNELFLGTEYGLAGSPGDKKSKLERIRLFANPVTRDTIKTASLTAVSDYGSGAGMYFSETRSKRSAPTDVGVPIVVIGWASLTSSYTISFPDDGSPSSNTPYVIATTLSGSTTHQGRVVISFPTQYDHGASSKFNNGEDLKWTDVNNVGTLGAVQTFYPERSDGYAVMASMSANELFLLKTSGAIVVSGDLDNPTVINLPMVPGSTVNQRSCRSRLGLVYGDLYSGVWVWPHGDTAELLSPSMLPNFWITSGTPDVAHVAASFHAASDFIFTSSGFYFDITTKAWWKVDETANIGSTRYVTGWGDYLYWARASYTNAALTAVAEYALSTRATSYSWQSHPLVPTIDSNVRVRALSVRAKGTGTVTITITAQDATTSSKVFTFGDNTYPHLLRSDFALKGEGLVVRIESAGTGGNEAPTVYAVNVGWHEVEHLAAS